MISSCCGGWGWRSVHVAYRGQDCRNWVEKWDRSAWPHAVRAVSLFYPLPSCLSLSCVPKMGAGPVDPPFDGRCGHSRLAHRNPRRLLFSPQDPAVKKQDLIRQTVERCMATDSVLSPSGSIPSPHEAHVLLHKNWGRGRGILHWSSRLKSLSLS